MDDEGTWITEEPASDGEFTRLLRNGRAPRDVEALLSLVYSELHRLAVSEKFRFPETSLQATEILNAAYLRLTEKGQTSWKNRRFFLFLAGRAMRDILWDHLNRKRRACRGDGMQAVSLDSICEKIGESPDFLSPLTAAIIKLGNEDRLGATVVELRFFYGLRREEVAAFLGVSARTVDRRWRASKTRLRQLMMN